MLSKYLIVKNIEDRKNDTSFIWEKKKTMFGVVKNYYGEEKNYVFE